VPSYCDVGKEASYESSNANETYTNACKDTYFRYVFYVYTIHNIYIQFNYMDGEDFVFMNMETFDTETVPVLNLNPKP
jgi:translation elongation factor P/translation initiation factor 5A